MENNDSFFESKENYDKFKGKQFKYHHENQSTELMPSEELFIKQKEEIIKIKKKRLELPHKEIYKKNTNLKLAQIRKNNNLSLYNTLNTISSNKNGKKIIKSNSTNSRYLNRKKDKNSDDIKMNNSNIYDNNLKTIKLKLEDILNINDSIKDNENLKIEAIKNDNKEDNILDENYIKNYINNNDIINTDNDIDNSMTIINENNLTLICTSENEIDFLTLSNTDGFQKCECELKIGDDDNDEDENTLPIINEKWRSLYDVLNKKYLPLFMSNFEFSKNVIKTTNVIDYSTKGIEINIHLKLYEKSEFYIFTRCYIDDNNNNFNNDETKKNNNISRIFNEYSTVIKIFKNRNSKKSFVSFGTFYKSKKSGNIHYKTFLQRQLVDFLHQDKNYYYLENDLCEFDIIIIDLGFENIEAKISLNNKYKFNNINSNFYLPFNKRAKIMFCGEGKSAKVTDLKIRSFSKDDGDNNNTRFGTLLTNEQKSCDCCIIL